jgi:O-antigen/teichoic acid export membrane protein
LLIYLLILLSQLAYIRHLGQLSLKPNLGFLKKPLLKDMAHYCFYGFFGSLGSRFSSEFISIFMVGTISTLTNTGIFTIAYFVANVIDVPRKAISRIVSPILADKWKEDKRNEIADIYQKTSLNQLMAGLWLFLVIWVSIDEIYEIMPNGEAFVAGKYVVFILGLARIIDMVTGVNSEIISFSRYYRYNFYLILFMAVIHIVANLFLIQRYEIVGAALAALISIFLFNLAKFFVLKWRLSMQPFTRQTLLVLIVAGTAYGVSSWIPSTGLALADAVIKSGVLTVIFTGLVLYFKVSPDVNELVVQSLKRLKNY